MISQKINNTYDLKKISDKIDFRKITDKINLKEISDKIDLKNDETSQPSYKNYYVYYIKNPNILADKIVEIYNANPNASVVYPRNKKSNVKLYTIVNKIDRNDAIGKQYKEFVKEFRNIHKNIYIEYDYQTYKNLVLDRINKKEVSTSNNDSFVKKLGKEFVKNLTGRELMNTK